jgi:NAD-specific glutamate dehydrogenase
MDNFPEHLKPSNKESFSDIRKTAILKILRKNIHDLVLKENENDFFDLVIFDKQNVNDISLTKNLVQIVIEELHNLGWKTKLSYGDTGLFIYSTENPPISAW